MLRKAAEGVTDMKELMKLIKRMVKSVLGKNDKKEVQTPAMTNANSKERYRGLNMLFFESSYDLNFFWGIISPFDLV